MHPIERSTSELRDRRKVHGRDHDLGLDYPTCDEPTFPSHDDAIANHLVVRMSRPAPVARVNPTPRPARPAVVADAPIMDDWILVAVGLGMSSSMLALLVMMFTGYGAL